MIKRALLSVYNKRGIVGLAQTLHDSYGVEIISTGGTSKLLKDRGIPHIEVSDFTGSPEILGGRLKTLHPKIHGGLLYKREDSSQVAEALEYDIIPIDLVVVNLYPFAETVKKEGATSDEIIEQIDIGGPTMLRSGAKNHHSVTVIEDPEHYDALLQEMRENKGRTSLSFRIACAKAVFKMTSAYDADIEKFFGTI